MLNNQILSNFFYRRTPKPFHRNKNSPGDWNVVWCEFEISTGMWSIFQLQSKNASKLSSSPSSSSWNESFMRNDSNPNRKVLSSFSIANCHTKKEIIQTQLQNVRYDGRECLEISLYASSSSQPMSTTTLRKKEILAAHETAYNVCWWLETLLVVKQELLSGKVPCSTFVCPPPSSNTSNKSNSSTSEFDSTKFKKIKSGKSASGSNTKWKHQPQLPSNIKRYERFTLYETAKKCYLVCSDRHYSRFRMLHLDRTYRDPKSLSEIMYEDPEVYSFTSMNGILEQLSAEVRINSNNTDNLVVKLHAVAFLGFIRFLHGYYLLFITGRRKIGCIGGNFIYGIDATEEYFLSNCQATEDSGDGPLKKMSWSRRLKTWLNPSPEEEAEQRYLGLFHLMDLTKDFYYSYSYDLTQSLQHNMLNGELKKSDEFVWNHYLTSELENLLTSNARVDLIQPVLYGCYEQKKTALFGRSLSLVLIARRSRHFAGTRYLKRGIADTGHVANEVELEQLLEDENMGGNRFSSFVQYRGSIPIYWTQETSVTIPKPPIVLNRVDPTYQATRKHFAHLFERYGSPLVVLNLVKQSEKREREVIVGVEFRNAIEYLNSFILPHEKKKKNGIRYVALDYSRISKTNGLSVSKSLDDVALWALQQTGFFCSAPKKKIFFNPQQEKENGSYMIQNGVLRTNCIDCLDRTNVGQFSVGIRALGMQLYTLGVLSLGDSSSNRNEDLLLETDSAIVQTLMHMYSLVGDAISMQYGGSEAHKNVKTTHNKSEHEHQEKVTLVKNSKSTSTQTNNSLKHKELLTSLRRYYSNSFTDMMKQDAINVFLGNYIPKQQSDGVHLWEMESDYYLHNFNVEMGPFHNYLKQQNQPQYRNVIDPTIPIQIKSSDSNINNSINHISRKSSCGGSSSYASLQDLSAEERVRRKSEIIEIVKQETDWWIEPIAAYEASVNPHPLEVKDDPYSDVFNKPSTSSSGGGDIFLTMYHLSELTSFDKVLQYPFMSPIDLHDIHKNIPQTEQQNNNSSNTTDYSDKTMTVNLSVCGSCNSSRERSYSDSMNSKQTNHLSSVKQQQLSATTSRTSYWSTIKNSLNLEGVNPRNSLKWANHHLLNNCADDGSSANRYGYFRNGASSVRRYFIGDRAIPIDSSCYERYVKSDINREVWDDKVMYNLSRCRNKLKNAHHGNKNYSPYGQRTKYETEQQEKTLLSLESYLQENEIEADDVVNVKKAQIFGGAMYDIPRGRYAGCSQGLSARKLMQLQFQESSSNNDSMRNLEPIFEETICRAQTLLEETGISPESKWVYQSFFQSLPTVIKQEEDATRKTKFSVSLKNRLKPRKALAISTTSPTISTYNMIAVGPLFRHEGSQSKEFVLFNEIAAENNFGLVEIVVKKSQLHFEIRQ